MASVEEFADRKYLNADALGGVGGEQREVIITSGEKVSFKEDDGTEKVKMVFDLEGEDMRWIANVTNLRIIGKVHGDNYKEWQYPFPATLFAIPTGKKPGISCRL